ncbi:MAG: ABC transporter ATP-binding protein [Candidatus Aenigmatarchaeota archaeon]
MTKAILELKDVWKIYQMKGVETYALRGVSLRIDAGQYTSIVGPSGSGKSTLMHILGCLDTPTKGKVFVDGKDVSQLNEDELALIRRKKIGFVFQAFNLINSLTALENVTLPMRLSGYGRKESFEKAKQMLSLVGLEKRINHKPNEMSGGEQQRVAIARALINDPEIILADEPTGNLDTKTGREIFELLEELYAKHKKTLIIVTHDLNLSGRAHREIRIRDGQIVGDHVRSGHTRS